MSDQELIQGVWQVTTGERGGKPFPDEVVGNAQLVFEGDQMTTVVKGGATAFKFELLPDQMPKAINLDMDGVIGMGIYELAGDSLTIAHTEAGQGRPREFTPKPGTSLTLMSLKRVRTP
jgi:uncharacterized protein (TIGR03067 family)